MKSRDDVTGIYERHAEICKALANAKRLHFLHLLRDGERSVTELQEATGLPQATVSQHLAALRRVRLVQVRHAGVSAYYAIADPEIIAACTCIHHVLLRQLADEQDLATTLTVGAASSSRRKKGTA
jgi:ArsR family transcriptional regulator